jgi:eukaryotic-like serine/threonine-protein kinase
VQPFPSLAGKWQISVDGGVRPRWRRDGKELFYFGGGQVMAVSVSTEGASFKAGKPTPLFGGPYLRTSWDVSADGQRFLMIKAGGPFSASITRLNVVLNWQEELKQRVPTR